jgi:hypothetical protein
MSIEICQDVFFPPGSETGRKCGFMTGRCGVDYGVMETVLGAEMLEGVPTIIAVEKESEFELVDGGDSLNAGFEEKREDRVEEEETPSH